MKTRALRNLSNCLRTLLIAAAFAPAVTFGSVDGGGSTGGGDASSSDIRVIAKMFADKEAVKTNLATILTTFNRFEASGQVPQQLKLLIA